MVVKLFMSSYSTTGALATLAEGDDVYIADGVNVGSTNDRGVVANFSNHTINVFGNLINAGISIDMEGIASTSNNQITIAEHSKVWSYDSVPVVIHSANSSLDNEGYIKGYWGLAVGSAAAVSTTIVNNDGTIEATDGSVATIYRYFGSADTINITSTGTIKGPGLAYTSQGFGGKENFLNSGVIVGGIKLDGGDDKYDGRLGSVKGIVAGGDGADTLYGGKEGNELHGDGGKDRIYGAGGADKLYGGIEADTFVFNKTSESTMAVRDIIYDFNHVDTIDLHTIDAKSSSSVNDAFTFIGSAAFGGHAGELRYTKSGGNTYVYGDTNGDGATDFSIKIVGLFTMEKGDFLV
ncbi:Ca2+-binding RTX toxin-like protein [Pararhizobium capsulatum DSM 1112]|uniref:Ca2+-binding RTX toxin-like protein n=1 Tax=Pararhizobium capsulatum DSM 1112 TaxID=1121113 RepID=A0ABU0C0E0_9HYPH|nr:hypothetical protein [Pararhizobium capsulatum]MDQ0323984.1 Ca2+-binding RTX toxin-like protein [Pararhizobium capsulatum DSM 1112]